MIDTTFTIKCEGELIASNVRTYNIGMIVKALIERYYDEAAHGHLEIIVTAEKNTSNDEDELLPF